MKYLKYYNEARKATDIDKLNRDLFRNPYDEKKDNTKTDPRIIHLSVRLFKLFKAMGLILNYNPVYRCKEIIGTNKQIRIDEGHYFELNLRDIKEYSIIYYLVDNIPNKDLEFAINISCNTLSKDTPQLQLGDDLWEKSLVFIKDYFKKLDLNNNIKKCLLSLIDSNTNFDAQRMKDNPEINITDDVLKTIMLNISNKSNSQLISVKIKKYNTPLYNKIMVLYNKLKNDVNEPLSNFNVDIASDLTDIGFND